MGSFTRTPDGKTRTQKLAETFKSNPSSVAFHDANQDGLADLVVLIPYEKIKILLQVPGKDFEEADVAPPGGTVGSPRAGGTGSEAGATCGRAGRGGAGRPFPPWRTN